MTDRNCQSCFGDPPVGECICPAPVVPELPRITYTGPEFEAVDLYGAHHPFKGMRDPIGEHYLKGCDNPACPRAVSVGTLYCCGGCDRAHSMKCEPGDLPHDPPLLSHGESCDERWAKRSLALKRVTPIWMEMSQ